MQTVALCGSGRCLALTVSTLQLERPNLKQVERLLEPLRVRRGNTPALRVQLLSTQRQPTLCGGSTPRGRMAASGSGGGGGGLPATAFALVRVGAGEEERTWKADVLGPLLGMNKGAILDGLSVPTTSSWSGLRALRPAWPLAPAVCTWRRRRQPLAARAGAGVGRRGRSR